MPWPAVGVVGALRPMRKHGRPREAGAGGPVGAALAAGARRSEIEETRRPVD